jgi:hypothetical protein
MATNQGKQPPENAIELRSIAKAIDRVLVRLVTLAPFALFVLLVSEPAREYSSWIVAAVFIGAIFTAILEYILTHYTDSVLFQR